MSTDQVKEFVTGLKDLSEDFKADSQEMADTYKNEVKQSAQTFEQGTPEVKAAAEQFQTSSHEFATGMIDRANQYVQDVEGLYESIYGQQGQKK